jgi:hypothetical protein
MLPESSERVDFHSGSSENFGLNAGHCKPIGSVPNHLPRHPGIGHAFSRALSTSRPNGDLASLVW